ncbi:MAG: DUF4337 domain-containing protein [Chloroflexi bacterium]|nr:DUF4337 domain-containing protein [Chloroflexota bacterium]
MRYQSERGEEEKKATRTAKIVACLGLIAASISFAIGIVESLVYGNWVWFVDWIVTIVGIGILIGSAFSISRMSDSTPMLVTLVHLAIGFFAIAQKSLGHIVRWEHFPTPHHVFELSSGLFD